MERLELNGEAELICDHCSIKLSTAVRRRVGWGAWNPHSSDQSRGVTRKG